jgi:hypothetical protein
MKEKTVIFFSHLLMRRAVIQELLHCSETHDLSFICGMHIQANLSMWSPVLKGRTLNDIFDCDIGTQDSYC